MEEISVCDFMNSEIADKIDIISKKDLQRLVTFFSTASFDKIMMVLKAVETQKDFCDCENRPDNWFCIDEKKEDNDD